MSLEEQVKKEIIERSFSNIGEYRKNNLDLIEKINQQFLRIGINSSDVLKINNFGITINNKLVYIINFFRNKNFPFFMDNLEINPIFNIIFIYMSQIIQYQEKLLKKVFYELQEAIDEYLNSENKNSFFGSCYLNFVKKNISKKNPLDELNAKLIVISDDLIRYSDIDDSVFNETEEDFILLAMQSHFTSQKFSEEEITDFINNYVSPIFPKLNSSSFSLKTNIKKLVL